MTRALPDKLAGMVEELRSIEDLTQKYEALIEIGRQVPDIPTERKIPENLVHGCQSVVHVYTELSPGDLLEFYGHADALVVNGMLALLLALSGLKPKEFLVISPEFVKETGVVQTLTPARQNGFYNIHKKMKQEALRYAN